MERVSGTRVDPVPKGLVPRRRLSDRGCAGLGSRFAHAPPPTTITASAEIQKRYCRGVTKSEIADARASAAPRRFEAATGTFKVKWPILYRIVAISLLGKFVNIRINFFFDHLMAVRVVCRKFVGVRVVLHATDVMTQIVSVGLLVASSPRQAVIAFFGSLAQHALQP